MPATNESTSVATRVPFAVGWVFLGGAVGSLLRFALLLNESFILTSAFALIAVNVLGAFLLGVLTGWLSHTANTPQSQRLRLLVGTGLLGGFTSYSALTLVTSQLLSISLVVTALFSLGSLLIGLVAAWLGLMLGRSFAGRIGAKQ